MIEITNVTVGYEDAAGVPALADLSAVFPDQKLTVIIGPNGSGKSTLLRTIMRFLPVTSGTIRHNGIELSEMSERDIARKTAYLPQSRPIPQIRVKEMVLHGRFPYLSFPRQYSQHDRDIVKQSLREADAAELEKQYMNEISGGQRQKVYIAMALAQQTKNILMDEPTTYLDIRHQFQTMRLLKKIAQDGRCAAVVLHDLGMAFAFADQLIVLEHGKIRMQDTPDEVYTAGIIPEIFGVELVKTVENNMESNMENNVGKNAETNVGHIGKAFYYTREITSSFCSSKNISPS